MKWVKQPTLDYRRPEVLGLDDVAEVMLHRGRAYAGDVQSKGFIPEQALPFLIRAWTPTRAKAAAAALVDAGLWEPVQGGWHVVGWEVDQADLDALVQRRRADAERQARLREQRRAASAAAPPPPVTALREALEAKDVETSWAGLSADEHAEIVALVERHGQDRLVAATVKGWRPDDPARSVRAFLPAWRDLRPPRKKPTRKDWCGSCDQATRMTDEDKPRRCPTCGGA